MTGTHYLTCVAGIMCGVLMSGCGSRPNEAYFKERTLCWQEERLLFVAVQDAILERGTNATGILTETTAHLDQARLHCPATAEWYRLNPDVTLWTSTQTTGDVAVVCPKHHASMPEGKKAYLAVTFDGRLMEMSQLPAWASNQKHGSDSQRNY